MNQQSFIVETIGRLDKIITKQINQSRNQVEQLIKEGLVSLNGKVVTKTGYKLSIGDEIKYSFREPIAKEKVLVDFDVDIIYEDDVMMVVNKPSGLVVHPAPSVKEATLVDWLIQKG
ncbi:MAG: RluA family pseudouridine synthase, partial [Sulfurovaceae bacterium]|nr:RluA family pseudouridine synthase [Sulfurovaceae bacterium]